ncbi:WhiB family transcriptional regulator [Nocardia tengchongensis]|uniref:WhiB family transcriptional regulator n=1 Tax=Nocardia tengchongensis TaxID=2055889 RepID=UPI0036763D7B
MWRDRAACIGLPIEEFFPLGGPEVPERKAAVRAAKRVCKACPVRRACLDEAVKNGDHYGIFGGVDLGDSEADIAARHYRRRKLRRIAKAVA